MGSLEIIAVAGLLAVLYWIFNRKTGEPPYSPPPVLQPTPPPSRSGRVRFDFVIYEDDEQIAPNTWFQKETYKSKNFVYYRGEWDSGWKNSGEGKVNVAGISRDDRVANLIELAQEDEFELYLKDDPKNPVNPSARKVMASAVIDGRTISQPIGYLPDDVATKYAGVELDIRPDSIFLATEPGQNTGAKVILLVRSARYLKTRESKKRKSAKAGAATAPPGSGVQLGLFRRGERLEIIEAAKSHSDPSVGEKLHAAAKEIPTVPAAYKRACVCIRALIREHRKEGLDFIPHLNQLYRVACVYDFFSGIPYLEEAGLPCWQLAEVIKSSEIETLNMPYGEIGFEHLALLNKTDAKWIAAAFGEPTGHLPVRDYHPELYQEGITRLKKREDILSKAPKLKEHKTPTYRELGLDMDEVGEKFRRAKKEAGWE